MSCFPKKILEKFKRKQQQFLRKIICEDNRMTIAFFSRIKMIFFHFFSKENRILIKKIFEEILDIKEKKSKEKKRKIKRK